MKLNSKTLSSQVKEALLTMIKDMSFMDQLPSENKLASQFGVSRNTVREALKVLENQGLVILRHGIGTFVTRYNSDDNIRYNIAALDSTTKIISDHGYKPGTKSMKFNLRTSNPEISKHLGSETPLETLYIERVRTADDTPIVFVEDYIPCVDGMIEDYTKNKYPSLFDFINQYSNVSFSSCSIHAVLSDDRLMDKLSINEPEALLLLQQIHYSSTGVPVFYSDSYFLTEKLEFNIIRRFSE